MRSENKQNSQRRKLCMHAAKRLWSLVWCLDAMAAAAGRCHCWTAYITCCLA